MQVDLSGSIDRDPWWGVLVRGPVDEGKRELARSGIEHDDHVFVPGDGWYGFYSFRHETIGWELADAVRRAGREVIVLHYDEDGQGFAHRWCDGRWDQDAAELYALAREHGIEAPAARLEGRPCREAALVEGRSLDEVLADADGGEVIMTPRGPLVVGAASAGLDYSDHPSVTCFQLVHYLDDNEFSCSVQRGPDVAVFGRPPRSGSGIPRLDEVEGETEPRNIIRKLGIPEHYLYP